MYARGLNIVPVVSIHCHKKVNTQFLFANLIIYTVYIYVFFNPQPYIMDLGNCHCPCRRVSGRAGGVLFVLSAPYLRNYKWQNPLHDFIEFCSAHSNTNALAVKGLNTKSVLACVSSKYELFAQYYQGIDRNCKGICRMSH